MNEFDINWLKGRDYAEVTAPNASALKTKIMKWWIAKVPGVVVTAQNKDGSIVAHVPISFVRVSRNKKRKISDEQIARLAQARQDYYARKAAEKASTQDDLTELFDSQEGDTDAGV